MKREPTTPESALGPASTAASADLFPIFQLTPVPLWLEDWSGIRRLVEQWRKDGMTDPGAFLAADPARVRASMEAIRILEVNAATLRLFEARDTAELVGRLADVFQGAMVESHREEIVQIAGGAAEFSSQAVNHTLSGRRLDIQLKGRILPGYEASWERVLIATEDVTERERARRGLAESEAYAMGLFENSPVSLWVEDFSAIRELLEDVRATGVADFRIFLDVHPEFITRCMSEIRVVAVNRQTLGTFRADRFETLLSRLGDVFRDQMVHPFKEQLVDLWNGRLFQSREVVNYSLDGEEMHFVMQFSVLPGHEADWSLVQIALTDITARKKAEAYLEYLGKHDVLTKLYNRSFYNDELNRIERRKTETFSVLVADLNGLKSLNDQLGHAAGDTLLRRAGEVLAEAVRAPWTAARIGGDEFTVLMPGATLAEATSLMNSITELCEVNNQFYPGADLSLAMGVATLLPGERLEDLMRRADLLMYEVKRRFYETSGADRRGLPL
ncbi:sensor domain-containing diguanylate cyclase [Aureimonas sp. AU40]|uniref:sensor domain-containing diguanylate cyclase n=1 Tax=Aureimonas sp. AU40 TaxID=1637747 RepID=UPI000784A0D6|nr:GGDEF domain-containing protein [Aureimonas sp. AU40]